MAPIFEPGSGLKTLAPTATSSSLLISFTVSAAMSLGTPGRTDAISRLIAREQEALPLAERHPFESCQRLRVDGGRDVLRHRVLEDRMGARSPMRVRASSARA